MLGSESSSGSIGGVWKFEIENLCKDKIIRAQNGGEVLISKKTTLSTFFGTISDIFPLSGKKNRFSVLGYFPWWATRQTLLLSWLNRYFGTGASWDTLGAQVTDLELNTTSQGLQKGHCGIRYDSLHKTKVRYFQWDPAKCV